MMTACVCSRRDGRRCNFWVVSCSLKRGFRRSQAPDITRKITACVACRKLKIKCHMNDLGPPCTRCKDRGLSCTVNKSLQMILENDMSYMERYCEHKIQGLEDNVATLLKNNHNAIRESRQPDYPSRKRQRTERDASEEPDQRPPETWQVATDNEAGPNAGPGAYVPVVANIEPSSASRMSQAKAESDFITQDLINPDAAERLFRVYSERLDHFLYSIIGDHSTMQSVRNASTTLASAKCAVSALHSSSDEYDVCHREFRRRVSQQFFCRQHTLDEVRNLCIGAFWLSEMSWALVGAAVRIAVEIGLHRIFVSPDREGREWYTRARVYLLVYVCDHHFSVMYGRPPLTRELNLGQARDLLRSQHAGEDDYRLFAQAELWACNYRIYKTFGLNNHAPLQDSSLSDFRRLSIALDTWRADWEEKFGFNKYVGNYPAKGVGLHYHIGKLFLCSHALRMVSTAPPASAATIAGLDEYTAMAVSSAMSILQGIVVEDEIQSYLNGLPTYFDTMIAFAVVFLLKLMSRDGSIPNIDRNGILDLLNQVSTTLARITAAMRPQHLLSGISISIKKLITKADQARVSEPSTVSYAPMDPPLSQAQPDNNGLWTRSPDDAIFPGNFDFTGTSPDLDFSFMDFSSFQTITDYP